jgi:hypothetical protein
MAMEYIWNCCWLSSSGAFMYTDRVASDGSGDMSPAPDLNLLIVPAFGWLYYMTGDATWQQRGDAIFSAGVQQGPSFIYLGKQYNQNYRWSFNYVNWRQMQLTPLYAAIGTGGAPIGNLPTSGGGGVSGGGSGPAVTTGETVGPNGTVANGGQPRNFRKR